jgi:phage tail-like protein
MRGLLVADDAVVSSAPTFEARGGVRLASLLPAIYQQLDPNAVAFCDALDEVLAPAWLTIDNIDAYLDPHTAPADFVAMLAAWSALSVDDNWTEDETRRLVAHAVELYRWAGTPWGVASMVAAYTGVYPLVIDSGGTAVSSVPDGPAPGEAIPAVRVTVPLQTRSAAYVERLDHLVRSVVPAHVVVRIDVTDEKGNPVQVV